VKRLKFNGANLPSYAFALTVLSGVLALLLGSWLAEDYDGPQGAMRPCHWQLHQVGASFTATGAPTHTRYSAYLSWPEGNPKEHAVTVYFSKRSYPAASTSNGEPHSTYGRQRSQIGPANSDDDLFSATLSARQVQP
jgi:hypothetical protein